MKHLNAISTVTGLLAAGVMGVAGISFLLKGGYMALGGVVFVVLACLRFRAVVENLKTQSAQNDKE